MTHYWRKSTCLYQMQQRQCKWKSDLCSLLTSTHLEWFPYVLFSLLVLEMVTLLTIVLNCKLSLYAINIVSLLQINCVTVIVLLSYIPPKRWFFMLHEPEHEGRFCKLKIVCKDNKQANRKGTTHKVRFTSYQV